jgi:hypothetical protein
MQQVHAVHMLCYTMQYSDDADTPLQDSPLRCTTTQPNSTPAQRTQ